MDVLNLEKIKALAQYRAEAYEAEHYIEEVNAGAIAYTAGALDPVLEEARRAMFRAEAFEEAKAIIFRELNDKTPAASMVFIGQVAQAEREKLKRILEDT